MPRSHDWYMWQMGQDLCFVQEAKRINFVLFLWLLPVTSTADRVKQLSFSTSRPLSFLRHWCDYFDLCHIYWRSLGNKQLISICTPARFVVWQISAGDATKLHFVTVNLYHTICLSFPWDLQLKSCVPLLPFQCVLSALQSLERMITGCSTKVW